MTREERYVYMTETPVKRLIAKLAIPTIISMLVSSIYNMADTYFVSQISTEASAAVGIIFSIMGIIQAIGFTLGIGSGNYVSRLLGMKEYEKAKRTVSTAFFTAFFFGLAICVTALSFLTPFVRLLGAIDSVEPYAESYAKYILIAAPFMMPSFVLNNQLRSQGNAFLAMIGITTGAVLNIFLDPILIFKMKLGISGAAIATMITQIFSFCILFAFNNLSKTNISVKFKNFRPSREIYKEIVYTGFPSLCRQGLASISSIVLNIAAGGFGVATLSALSIVNRYMLFIHSGLVGFCQGFQPVSGFNYGAKKYDRVKNSFYFCVKVGIAFMTLLGIVSFIFAPDILALFRKSDPAVIEIGTLALRLQSCTLPFQAFSMMSQFLSQSIGLGGRASLVAMGRQGLFLIPLYIILSKNFRILGLQLSQPISDILTCSLAILITLSVIKMLNNLQKNNFSLT